MTNRVPVRGTAARRVGPRRLRELGYEIPEDRIIQVGAAIGTHIGPNAVGFVCVGQ